MQKTNINWGEHTNGDSETVLHILAKSKSGLGLFNMIYKDLKFKAMEDVIMCKDTAGNTPLHNAACSGQLDICKQLVPIANDNAKLPAANKIIGEKNVLGQTAVHVACKMGHKEIVEYFWKVIQEKDLRNERIRRDDDRQSYLHLAAANSKSIDNL